MPAEKVLVGSSERISPLPRGASRDFLGESLEGRRADALNHATGYAFAPDVDLDVLTKTDRRLVVHAAMMRFMSHKDWKNQVTQVLYDQIRPEKALSGFGYITKKEKDVRPRAERVVKLAKKARVSIQDATEVFEMNFDAPWHRGEAYEAILTSGMRDMLGKFFKTNPNASIYMFVEDEDMASDGNILSALGGRKVGSSVYLNNATQEDLSDATLDSIYVINGQMFK